MASSRGDVGGCRHRRAARRTRSIHPPTVGPCARAARRHPSGPGCRRHGPGTDDPARARTPSCRVPGGARAVAAQAPSPSGRGRTTRRCPWWRPGRRQHPVPWPTPSDPRRAGGLRHPAVRRRRLRRRAGHPPGRGGSPFRRGHPRGVASRRGSRGHRGSGGGAGRCDGRQSGRDQPPRSAHPLGERLTFRPVVVLVAAHPRAALRARLSRRARGRPSRPHESRAALLGFGRTHHAAA